LLRGLDEEGWLDVSGGRAVAAGDTLPRRLSDTMQQRLDSSPTLTAKSCG